MLLCNPPSVPTLVAVKWASWLRRSAFIVDWHNFGYTLLALSLGRSSLRSILGRWQMVPYARQGQCNMNWHKTGELTITDLPFSLYSTFVIEARHGFIKLDMIKGIILATIIGPPIVAAIIVIVQRNSLAIYLWGFLLVLSLVMMIVYDVLIASLFNKLTPLPDGELCMVEKLFIHYVVGTIIGLLALTGLVVFMLFFLAAAVNAIIISLLVSLAAAGGFLGLFFACVTTIYIGALSVWAHTWLYLDRSANRLQLGRVLGDECLLLDWILLDYVVGNKEKRGAREAFVDCDWISAFCLLFCPACSQLSLKMIEKPSVLHTWQGIQCILENELLGVDGKYDSMSSFQKKPKEVNVRSGDSTVLAYVLSELNRRHNYGVNLFLLSVDEGIAGYRDDSLETVKKNEVQLWTTTKSGVLQGTVRMDNGRNSEDYLIKEQLHILWCFPSPEMMK
ncbi:unnamed protein product [Camellia sinensis]